MLQKLCLILFLITIINGCDENSWDQQPHQEDLLEFRELPRNRRDTSITLSSISIPDIAINCYVDRDNNSCEGENPVLAINCMITNTGDHTQHFDSMTVGFAEPSDRDYCIVRDIYTDEGVDMELQPGDTTDAAQLSIICQGTPPDQSIDLIFHLLKDKQWFYNVDFEWIQARTHYFHSCNSDVVVEGWRCDPDIGYPLWISSPEGRVEMITAQENSYQRGHLPDHGRTIFLDCDELPASFLIHGGKHIKAIAYEHDLPEFSVWRDYPGPLTLNPEEWQNLNTGNLHIEEPSQQILIRVPGFSEI